MQDSKSQSIEIPSKNDGKQLPEADKFIDPYIDYEKIAYDFCAEYYPELIKLTEYIYRRGRNQYDNQVSIEGVTGSGKSMFTLLLCLLVNYRLKRKFDMQNQCLFIPAEGEINKKMGLLKPLDVFWIDESIRALDKKTWYKKDQIELNHIVKTERWKGNTIFYNIQRFSEFTETFRNSNIFFRIIIIPRTYAVLRVMDTDADVIDPWHTATNIKLKSGFRNADSRKTFNVVLPSYVRLEFELKMPNYEMHTRFPDLSRHEILRDYYKYYSYLKQKSRELIEDKTPKEETMTERGKKYKLALSTLLKKLVNHEIDIARFRSSTGKYNRRKLHIALGSPMSDVAWNSLFKEE